MQYQFGTCLLFKHPVRNTDKCKKRSL